MPRYIDANKLLTQYKERCAGCKETKNYCEHCCDIADVISDIEDAPTADVVERKKGKWIITDIYNGMVWKCHCSECGELAMNFVSGLGDWWMKKLPNFCPTCGADMKGEETDAKIH